ncbi:hypothetical protein [uncultured Tenacibaculum sp.]|uniref:hypothetical protein n=1 Tax=uncultured Tenacibaculum sp. TaxID=174713 RepID=UPI00262267E0|nr:hypothetical protein [uncultured Tenacibaculum sp.]
MRLTILLFVFLLLNCKEQDQKGFIFSISEKSIKNYTPLNRTKLPKDLWRKHGLFNIESYNTDFNYYISHKSDSLKIIERIYDTENSTWLCLVNKNGFYLDHMQVAYDNAEGFLTVESEMIDKTVIVKTWNDFSDIKQTIDSIKITNETFRNPVKERAVVGYWKNETSNLSFKLFFKENQLHYTFTSPKRTFSNTAEITQNNLIIFKGFEWSEYAGGSIDDGESEEEKEDPPLPTKIGTTINFESNEFVIQNYGNAMNYYTKIEEASEKYVTFKRLKQ